MNNEFTELVENVFCDVFENLAFMFGELVDKGELLSPGTELIQASMSFSGAQTGEIILVVPDEMCPEIAANVLGLDPDEDKVHELAADALKEMINIICGQLLTEIAGEKPIFDLSVPTIQKIDPLEWSELLNCKSSK